MELLIGEFAIFTMASSFGYVGTLMLMFSIFKIEYRWYIPQMVFICIFLSYISFTMRMASLTLYAPTVQVITLIVIMWLLFRFQLLHAAIITVTGYILSAAVDFVWGYLFLLGGYKIEPFSTVMYTGAVLAGSSNILLASWIHKRRWGFSFAHEGVKERSDGTNLFFWISVIVFAVLGFFAVYALALVWYSPASIWLVLLQLFAACGLLVYFSYRSEKQGYERRNGFQ
ncbi:hypothetical protein DUZ99_11970 [Xylanibacillus composti]|uniref:Uncharacterized protein n=1 Tax=Xylanibacillus composti TaxID=1572762 RepID=A0A8J4H8Q3_9BACL|nr:hypothetical protein [Xylanibacillus composti]MDT9725690.1 hypothetical protein [Xylanibacillus composti]GIQ71169.1 hypothetical protein XYCOK13_39930 [Xylanibacillus composti]